MADINAEHEIVIHDFSERHVADIQLKFLKVNIIGDDREHVGMYRRRDSPESFFVHPDSVERAVRVLNNMGYLTSENPEFWM